MDTIAVNLTEDTLVREALSADPAALQDLMEDLRPRAIAMAYAVTGHRDDALDAAQNAMLRVFAREESRTLASPVIAVLYESVHSAAVDIVRMRANRRAREETVRQQEEQRNTAMPSQELERREMLDILRNEMAQLPPQTAAVIALHHMDDLPVEQVSKKTGLTVDACKHRLSRGREELRQRLERRGVALASTALLATLLNETFLAGKVCAAEIGTSGAAGTATPLPERAQDGAAARRSSPLPRAATAIPPASRIKHADAGNAALPHRTLPPARSRTGSKLFVAAIAALILLGGLALLQQRTLPAAIAPKTRVIEGDGQTNGPGDADAAKPNAAPRWVSADVAKDRMMPAALTAEGHDVSLLTTELTLDVLKAHRSGDGISLYTSHDDGQQWSKVVTFSDYSLGTMARSSNGGHMGIGLVNEVGEHYHSSTHAGSYDLWQFNRADWFVVDAAGTVKKREPLWTASATRPIFGPVTYILADGANWVFGRRVSEDNNFMRCDLLAATSNGADTPQPVSVARNMPGTFFNEHPLPAWATGRQAAGFVIYDDQKIQLVHTLTADGGKTWIDVPIPFNFDTESETKKLDTFEPIALTRDDKRLVLLFRMSSRMVKITEESREEAYFVQKFTIVSDDLGRTWKQALPVTLNGKREKMFAGLTGLSVCNDQFVISRNVLMDSDQSQTSPRHVSLLASKDAGATWAEVNTLGLKGDTTDSVLFGNAQGLYLAVRQVSPKNPGMLPASVSVQRLMGTEAERNQTLLLEPVEAAPAKPAPNF